MNVSKELLTNHHVPAVVTHQACWRGQGLAETFAIPAQWLYQRCSQSPEKSPKQSQNNVSGEFAITINWIVSAIAQWWNHWARNHGNLCQNLGHGRRCEYEVLAFILASTTPQASASGGQLNRMAKCLSCFQEIFGPGSISNFYLTTRFLPRLIGIAALTRQEPNP